MSRHGKNPGNRTRAAALIAAGAVTVATAAAAAAAAWTPGSSGSLGRHGPLGPPGSAAAHSHETGAGLLLTDTDQLTLAQAVTRDISGQRDISSQQVLSSQQGTASQAVQAYQIRDAAAELASAHWAAAREQAAKKAAANKIAAARAAAAQPTSQSGAQPAAQPQVASAAGGNSGSPQQIAQAMLGSFGWPSSQFSCLDPLWEQESGWSVTASNPSSGAYGIPQALPGSRMASAGPDWQSDAATQIRWGLEYIKDTYGSPCAAWSHEEATGWY